MGASSTTVMHLDAGAFGGVVKHRVSGQQFEVLQLAVRELGVISPLKTLLFCLNTFPLLGSRLEVLQNRNAAREGRAATVTV
jgi:hypothetical protein